MRFAILLVILATCVTAIGIAPANLDIDLNEEHEIEYRIYNTENRDVRVDVIANGSLTEYMKIEPSVLVFSKNERVKTVKITITDPEVSGQYSATISVGDKVEAKLMASITKPEPAMPTGMAVSETENPNYIYALILMVVIMANVVFLTTRKTDPAQKVLRKLRKIDRNQFSRYVTNDKNDFAEQLHEKMPELAFRIYDITSRRQMIHSIEEYVARNSKKKTPKELEKEIHELKNELDTFDFSDFEEENRK